VGAAAIAVVRLVSPPPPVAGLHDGVIRLHDGSLATPLDPSTELATIEDGARAALVELRRGRGRFQVVHTEGRTFSVRAGDVTVTVLGTIFSVERIADRIGVTVERGRVQVAWSGGARRLAAGESGWFPPLGEGARLETLGTRPESAGTTAGAPAPGAAIVDRAGDQRRGASPTGALRAATSPARSAGEGGSRSEPGGGRPPSEIARATPNLATPNLATPDRAPPNLTPPAIAPAPPTAKLSPAAAELLAAADAARGEGRLDEAVTLLRRTIDEHGGDPRAPLAAFTLGRLLLTELGRPAEAAAAFARARALAPDGPLAEDALAREVEAWSQAHDPARARARAEEYVRRFPAGRRLDSVRASSGL
jgi:transmembrane sensor